MKINKKKRERMKAKVMSLITDLMAFEEVSGVRGMPTGVYVHSAKKELAELAKHL